MRPSSGPTTRRRPRWPCWGCSVPTSSGMSTALEAIAARQLGAEVLGLSLVTNAAAGPDGAAVSHEEVIAAGARAAGARSALSSPPSSAA